MSITVTRKLTLNLGRYESMTVEVTLAGLDVDNDPDSISQQLDMIMAPEIQRAELASAHDPDDNDSSVYKWVDIIDQTTKMEGA